MGNEIVLIREVRATDAGDRRAFTSGLLVITSMAVTNISATLAPGPRWYWSIIWGP
jgi:hypothetical protein